MRLLTIAAFLFAAPAYAGGMSEPVIPGQSFTSETSQVLCWKAPRTHEQRRLWNEQCANEKEVQSKRPVKADPPVRPEPPKCPPPKDKPKPPKHDKPKHGDKDKHDKKDKKKDEKKGGKNKH